MNYDTLEIIKCPYCRGDLTIHKLIKEENERIITGTVRCPCNEYPVLDSILILQANRTKDHILESLDQRSNNVLYPLINYIEDIYRLQDFLRSKGSVGQIMAKALVKFIEWRNTRLYKKYSDRNVSFLQLFSSSLAPYLKNRFSMETFWTIYPTIPLLKQKKHRILDLGCGIGQASFVMSEYVEPDELICCDTSFRHLYIAKNFFVKNAQFISLDADYPLPFTDNTFSSILAMDILHYIKSHTSCVSEMERILCPNGLLLALHLHNSLAYNMEAGFPITPSNWVNLFKKIPIKAIPEKDLVEDFIIKNKLDLLTEHSLEELNISNTLCLVGSNDDTLFKLYEEIDSSFLNNKNNLLINPIYKIRNGKDKIILKRKSASEACMEDVPITERILPKKCFIDKHLSHSLNNNQLDIEICNDQENLQYIESLMKQFILINAPQRFG